MKKHILYLVLGVLTIPLISELVKADTNPFDGISCDLTLSPTSNSQSDYLAAIDDVNTIAIANHICDSQQNLAIDENASDINTNLDSISDNTADITSNTTNITTNASDIDTNTTNITTNASDIDTNTSAIETLQGSSNSADITANTNKINTNSANIIANTNKINTNTSNINSLGEGVAGSTALTAALSALPQMTKESKTTCGVGTGAYSSRYAVGFGCASKVSKRIDVNAGGSYVFGGSKSYGGGTLDSGVVKAGFVFKLGELNKPTQISLNESKVLQKEVKDLKAKNNQLLARLEKLENIALKFQSSSEMISVATKD